MTDILRPPGKMLFAFLNFDASGPQRPNRAFGGLRGHDQLARR